MTSRFVSRALYLVPALLVGAFGLGEIVFRLAPTLLPPGAYGSRRYDPDTRLLVHRRPMINKTVRLEIRHPNADGFLDVEHPVAKPDSTYRVGFFGDRYVEAQQVPIDSIFFRQIPANIRGRSVETFGFGGSHWGTVHALLNYRKFGHRYDLDVVIHSFYKNDPGDHARAVAKGMGVPLAVLAEGGPGYTVDFDDVRPPRPIRHFIQANSLLVNVLVGAGKDALGLVRDRGREGTLPSFPKSSGWVPSAEALPSTWPSDLMAETKLLTKRILADFSRTVRSDGRQFAVLYIPFGNQELLGELGPEDTWFLWLAETCEDLGIVLIDPRGALLERHAMGQAVYDDHWSFAGHDVIASVLTDYLTENLPHDTPK